MNTELFKKVHEVINDDLDQFDMDAWEDNSCGTTRCVGGWAIYFAAGEVPLYNWESSGVSEEVIALADRLGVQSIPDIKWVHFPQLAARVLGLEEHDVRLFHVGEITATEFVRLAAQGDEEGARAVLRYACA